MESAAVAAGLQNNLIDLRNDDDLEEDVEDYKDAETGGDVDDDFNATTPPSTTEPTTTEPTSSMPWSRPPAVTMTGLQQNNLVHDIKNNMAENNDLEDVEDYMDSTDDDDFAIAKVPEPAPSIISEVDVDGSVNNGSTVRVGDIDVHITKNYRWNAFKSQLQKHPRTVKIAVGVVFVVILIIIIATTAGGNKKNDELAVASGPSDETTDPNGGGDGKPVLPNFDSLFIEDYRPLLNKLYGLYDRHEIHGKSNLDPETSHGANETPQNKAFFWIAADLKLQPDMSHTQLVQRYVLTVLYFATNAVANPFYKETSDGRPSPYPWKSAYGWLGKQSECNWRGIGCNGAGLIEEISLKDNHMSGRLPQEIGFLGDNLKMLDLPSNFIYMDDHLDAESDYTLADIGDDEINSYDVFMKLTNLEYLDFEDNYLVYHNGFPNEFSEMTRLEKLDLSKNLLEGHFDRPKSSFALSKLTALTSLHLEENKLYGGVPEDVLGMLSNLDELYLYDNSLVFNLDFMKSGQLTNLEYMWIGENSITGEIPTEIGLLTSLESLAIDHCFVGGPIPTEMGRLTNLRKVWLRANLLSGQIPTELANLSKLEILELHGNSITGSVPQGICDIFESISSSDDDDKSLTADCAETFSSVQCNTDTCCTRCY